MTLGSIFMINFKFVNRSHRYKNGVLSHLAKIIDFGRIPFLHFATLQDF